MKIVRPCIRWTAGAALALAAAACSVLPNQAAMDVYRLPGSLAAPAQAPVAEGWSLRVGTPHSGGALDSARIAVIPSGDQITRYAGARWTDTPATLMRDRLAQAFRLDGRAGAISTSDSNVYADLEVDSDLRAFQSEYRGGQPYAVVGLNVRLLDAATRRVLASRSFEAAQPAAGVQVPAVVAAFGQASDAISGQVVQWVIATGKGRSRPGIEPGGTVGSR